MSSSTIDMFHDAQVVIMDLKQDSAQPDIDLATLLSGPNIEPTVTQASEEKQQLDHMRQSGLALVEKLKARRQKQQHPHQQKNSHIKNSNAFIKRLLLNMFVGANDNQLDQNPVVNLQAKSQTEKKQAIQKIVQLLQKADTKNKEETAITTNPPKGTQINPFLASLLQQPQQQLEQQLQQQTILPDLDVDVPEILITPPAPPAPQQTTIPPTHTSLDTPPPPADSSVDCSPQEMDLIDAMWQQDLDMGATREMFDTSLRRQMEKERELEKGKQLQAVSIELSLEKLYTGRNVYSFRNYDLWVISWQ